MDLGFYAFDLPFYRLVLSYLFVATFLAFIANLVGHYLFGGIRLSGRSGALSRAARIQLITLVGILMLLKAVAYWLDRYELLSHTRSGKPFTGAGYTDINAVLPAKLILMAIAVICAAAVFSAIVLRDLRIPAIGVVLLLLSSMVDRRRLAVGGRAVQRQAERGAEGKRIHQPKYHGHQTGLRADRTNGHLPRLQRRRADDAHSRWRRTGRRRRTSGCSIRPSSARRSPSSSRARTSTASPINWPWTATAARRQPARLRGGRPRTQPRPPDRQPARLDQPAHRVHPRQRFHRLAGQHRARCRQRSQPERRLPGVPGQRRRRQRQRRLARARAAGSAARLLRPGHRRTPRPTTRSSARTATRPRVRLRDQHRDQELHLHRPRRGADRQLADPLGVRREVRRAELLVLQRDRREQQDPVQPRSGRARARRWRRG